VQNGLARVGADFIRAANDGGLEGVAHVAAHAMVDEASTRINTNLVDPALTRLETNVLLPAKDGLNAVGSGINTLKTPEFWQKVAIGGGCALAAYFVAKFVAGQIEQHYNRPKLDFVDYIAAPTKHKVESEGFNKMVFAPHITKALNGIFHATQTVKELIQNGDAKHQYGRYAFYGPTGSGKRMCAEQLARYALMDFYAVPISELAKLNERQAIVALGDFFNEVGRSKNHAVIYLDNISLLGQKLVEFIEQTAKRDSSFVLIISAPLKPQWANQSGIRVDFEITMNLPQLEERKKVLKLYKERFFGNQRTQLAQAVAENLTDTKLEWMAQQLDGATAAELSGIMKAIQLESTGQGDTNKALELIDNVIDRSKQKYLGIL
jgi:ATPase family AAA domain-containing protein 3A/B